MTIAKDDDDMMTLAPDRLALEFGQLGEWLDEGGLSRTALPELSSEYMQSLTAANPCQGDDTSADPLVLSTDESAPMCDLKVTPEQDFLERRLLEQMRTLGVPEPEREFRFHPTRRWRFDFAWPELKVAAEVEGGTWSKGKSRHTTGSGYHGDLNKYNEAAAAGWIVARFDSKHVEKGDAARRMAELLAEHCA